MVLCKMCSFFLPGRTSLAFNSTSRYIMAGGKDGSLHAWDLKSKKLKKTYSNHKGMI